MYLSGKEYARPMSKFLNDFSHKMNRGSPSNIAVLKDIFDNSIGLIRSSINETAFRPVRSFNAAVFDSVMTGVAIRLGNGGVIDGALLKTQYEKLMRNPDYLRACERATADEETVRKRRDEAIRAFEEV